MRKKIFISYRREDEPAEARSIHDRLVQLFGQQNIFMDVDSLVAGVDFQKELDSALNECAVLIAIIGPEWETILKQRCDLGGKDYVADEISSALESGVLVIPVMVTGAKPANPENLPAELSSLAYRQAFVVSHEKFRSDVAELANIIHKQAGVPFSKAPTGSIMPRLAATVTAVLFVVAIGFSIITEQSLSPPTTLQPQEVRVLVFTHDAGLTTAIAEQLRNRIASKGVTIEVSEHVDRRQPNAIYIAEDAPIELVRKILEPTRRDLTHIFPVDYSTKSSVEMKGVSIAVGLMANFEYFDENSAEKPYSVKQSQLDWLVEEGLDQKSFVQRLRYLAPSRSRPE